MGERAARGADHGVEAHAGGPNPCKNAKRYRMQPKARFLTAEEMAREQQLLRLVRAIQAAPLLAGRLAQLEDHGERRFARQAALGPGGSQPHRGEGTFNRIRRSDVLPALGRKVVEAQQSIAVPDQAFDRLVVFGAVGCKKEVDQSPSGAVRACLWNLWERFANGLVQLRHRSIAEYPLKPLLEGLGRGVLEVLCRQREKAFVVVVLKESDEIVVVDCGLNLLGGLQSKGANI